MNYFDPKLRYQCPCCKRYFRVGKTRVFRPHYVLPGVQCQGVGRRVVEERAYLGDMMDATAMGSAGATEG